jgi:hypothetical protein
VVEGSVGEWVKSCWAVFWVSQSAVESGFVGVGANVSKTRSKVC